MPPNTGFLARAFYRGPHSTSSTSQILTTSFSRALSTSSAHQKWEGRQPEESPVREKDSHNVQHDAVKEGKEERAKGHEEGASRGASEKSGDSNKRAKEEFPEAPDTIGMQDERGQKV